MANSLEEAKQKLLDYLAQHGRKGPPYSLAAGLENEGDALKVIDELEEEGKIKVSRFTASRGPKSIDLKQEPEQEQE